MHFCFHCGKELPEGSSFCPFCGTQLASPAAQQPAAPVYEQPFCQSPVYQPPVQQPLYTQPVYVWQQPVSPPPPPSTGAKVMGYISMALGFTPYAMILFMSLFFSYAFGSLSPEGILGLIGILGLVCGIPARILAHKAVAGNFRSAAPRLGNIFGLLAIIFGSILFSVFVLAV